MTLSLLAFALMEYERRGWDMPDVHVRIYDWLERTEDSRTRVLRVFRGVGKSTILGIKNANKLRNDPLYQILVQGADDELAEDISRDTSAIMESHPLTSGMIAHPCGVTKWWTKQGLEANARTPQMRAKGILSRTTGNRADEIQSDDAEVEKNVIDDRARSKLRKKLSEQTHILKPGGSKLYVGTPHTHNSLYDELIAAGAEHLTIPLFAHQARYEKDMEKRTVFPIVSMPGKDGVWVFRGIGKDAQLLSDGRDYKIDGDSIKVFKAVDAVLDICTGNAWPERFHREEMSERRKECRTLNEWDSQYELIARPLSEIRLDPERLKPYDIEPILTRANGELRMMVGSMHIVSARMYWDCALGKVKADASAVSIFLEDDRGNYYWHRCEAMLGEYAEFNDDRNGHITGGQVLQVCALIRQFQIPTIYVENNGVGAFTPQLLRKALKQERLQCGVREVTVTSRKNDRILEGLEGPMRSGVLWAHTSVLDGPLWDQMKDWNPEITNQPDDYLDSGAGAILQAPVRIGKSIGELDRIMPAHVTHDWRPNAGVAEAAFEY